MQGEANGKVERGRRSCDVGERHAAPGATLAIRIGYR